MTKKRIWRSVITFALAFIMIFELFTPPIFSVTVSAADGYLGGSPAVADPDSSTKYSLSLGDNVSTENAGRIWTDKSVYAGDVSFATYGGGTLTYKLNENGSIGEDFLVAFSALASSESIEGNTYAPVDVVLIIDISGSMSNDDSEMDNGLSRIANTVTATNAAIKEIMALNEYSRVAVVAFSSTATVLLPLGRYTNATTVEREWVQQGSNRWDGYYVDKTVELPFFSLSTEKASKNYATLYTRAVSSTGSNINLSTSVEGGTNIQMGLYTGMNVLASETNTKANINGSLVQRVPSVILLSDGSPTFSSSSSTWWAPANNSSHGPGSSAYAGNGFKAILTGAYMKAAIDRNYGVAGTSFATTVYTVGMGITGLAQNEKNLAYMTLDPGTYWSSTGSNSMRDTIKGYWNSYIANNNTGNLNVNVGKYTNNRYSDNNVSIGHPTTGYDVNPANGYDYVDDYYDADNATAVVDVFDRIVASISLSAPQVPTEIKGDNPISDGYITYTDPIGEYMKVKDVKAIVYAGTEFKTKTVTVSGNVTTYTFEGSVHSAVYGDQEIENIIITVTEDSAGMQTLTVKIPASVIPLRVNYVTLNADGSVKSHTNNGAFPARVIYSVGISEDVVATDDNGNAYIDRTAISPEYIAANSDGNGGINFYSNLYTGTNTADGHAHPLGNATVEFEPAHNNGYYYVLEDMPIYKDEACTQQVSANEGVDDNGVYYYKDTYYHGASVETKVVARTGAQLKKTSLVTGTDGNLYREKGSPRIYGILDFEGKKDVNASGTTEYFYVPSFHYADGSTDAYDGKFVVYFGNNGVMTLPSGGNIKLTKTVTAESGLTAPDKAFDFTFDLDGDRVNQGSFEYVIKNEAGENVGMGTISASSPVISLKDGQTATVYSLPPGTAYTITETVTEGFTASSVTAVGTIVAGETDEVIFTNNYSVTPVSYPAEGGLGGQKVLSGREWTESDEFTFVLAPFNNAPLPAGYDAENGVTVTKADASNGVAPFNFGTITFTAPGTYRYTVYEQDPAEGEQLPGMTYSGALYRLEVIVTDNGNGALSVASVDLQRLYDDNANQLFTYDSSNKIVMNDGEEAQDSVVFVNTYSADSTVKVPVALKDYTDNSGNKPLVSGMFEFKLEAVGYLDAQGQLVTEIAGVPMPESAVNGVIFTTNEGGNVTFPAIVYSHAHIPQGQNSVTFRYKMSEVVPENALYGMTYDTAEHYIDVTVSVDSTDSVVKVATDVLDSDGMITFKNTYTPDPATAVIEGNKTLNGRDMKTGEEFSFKLEGANQATLDAMANGTVVVYSAEATVSGASDGVASAFDFGRIVFKKVGTYSFDVYEVAGNAPSVVYDGSVIRVTVVVSDDDNDGRLEAKSVTYSNGKNAAEFVNTYSAEFEGNPVSLNGIKNLTGKSLVLGEFFFNVEEYYNGTKVGSGLVSHTEQLVADADGVYSGEISFLDGVTYDKAGIYQYIITEQIPTPKVKGTVYDETQYRFTVVVEDVDKVGKLTVTSYYTEVLDAAGGWSSANGIVFNNTYTPDPAYASLPLIKKVIAGERSEPLKDGEFSFKMELVSASVAGGAILPAQNIVTNRADGSVIFGDITFTKAGQYVVKVTEVIPQDADKVAGITYSLQEIVATFNVVDDRNGNLAALLVNYTGGEIIVNVYEATPGNATVTISKEFTGRPNDEWLPTDKFDFEVVVLDEATQIAIENGYIEFPMDEGHIAYKTIASKGEVIIGNVVIHRAGTYKFIVREITGDIAGVNYDSQPREIVIVATDNSATATIDITVNGQAVNNVDIKFTNVYDADSTELGGHDNLTIEKNFTGRPDDKWLDSDEFVFVLEAGDSATQAAIEAGKVVLPSETTLVISNANKAHPHFGSIRFEEEGTYKFKITEQAGSIPGVVYDTSAKIITVKVEDNGNGELVASVVADQSDALVFANTYTAGDVTVDGEASLDVIKVINGREWNEDDEFTFVIAPYGQVTQSAIDSGDIVMPATSITVSATDLNADNGKTNHFGSIVFKMCGSYRFTIKETLGDVDKMTYDEHIYHVFINVTDNDRGQLEAEVTYMGAKAFVNEYTPDNASAVIEGTKELNGNRGMNEGEFTFVIEAVSQNAVLPAVTTVTNGAGGKVSFGELTFSEEGVYQYRITEQAGSIPGVEYDTEAVIVTVTVTYDEVLGSFNTSVKYVKGNGSAADSFVFVNTYKAEDSEPVSIDVTKKVESSEGNSYTVKGGEFEFVIEAVTDGAPMPSDTKVNNDAEGKAVFEEIVFTKPGTYVYKITETDKAQGGFTYDTSVYTVTVTVTDNTATAKLETAVKITDESGADASVEFGNSYDPSDAYAEIFGEKVVLGGYKDVEDGRFEFVIESTTDGAPMPAEAKVRNGADGKFRFGRITYDRVGVYEYKITETNLGEAGYTYDSTAFVVRVTVTDVNGQLTATVDGIGSAIYPEIVFQNTYTPKAGSAEIRGDKKLEGNRQLAENEFEFVLTDKTSGDTLTAKNNANGKFVITVEYTKAGSYEYTLAEKNNGLGGVTYDTSVYTVKVTVVDENGELKVTGIEYLLGENAVQSVSFVNTYKAEGTEVTVDAVKVMTGRTLKDKEFTFELKDKDGKVVYTAKNNDKGAIVFDKLVYNEAGKYEYTVSEVIGNENGVTYDKTIYTVEVTVTDNGNGKLVAEKAYKKSAEAVTEIKFSNSYSNPDVPQTNDRTHMGMWFALLFVSGMGVAAVSAFGKKKSFSVK